GVDGRKRQEAFLDLGGEHVADAVGRRLERHVRQQRGDAAVAAGDGDEMLEILLALREVLAVDLAEHRRIERDDTRYLLARRQLVRRDLREQRREVRQVLRVGAAPR